MSSSYHLVAKIGPSAELGEGVHYDNQSKTVYWVDILGMKVFQYDRAINKVSCWTLPYNFFRPSLIIPYIEYDTNGCEYRTRYLIADCDKICLWNPETNEREEVVANIDQMATGTRLNDGKLYNTNHLWVGSMDMLSPPRPNLGKLFSYDILNKTISAVTLLDYSGSLIKITLSNGMGWDKSGNTFYHIDTPTRQVKIFTKLSDKFEWYPCDGEDVEAYIREKNNQNPRVRLQQISHIDLVQYKGVPDGMTVNRQTGHLYIAMWDGGQVLVIDPALPNQLADLIELPVSRPTNCTIDDEGFVYITTAYVEGEKDSGKLFVYKA